MADNDTITIRVKEDTWKRLNGRKGPGDSFDDVINDLLNQSESGDSGNRTATAMTAD